MRKAQAGTVTDPQEKQALLECERAYIDGVILRREEEERQAEAEILQANEMLHDLVAMMKEQGVTIDKIDSSVKPCYGHSDELSHNKPEEISKPEPFDATSLTVSSPFPNYTKLLDDVYAELEFVIIGLEEPLHLHRSCLNQASSALEALFQAKSSMYGAFNEDARRVVWLYGTGATGEREFPSETYSHVLLKWIRFCYGEDQTFEMDEYTAALVVLLQLKLKCDSTIMETIEKYIMYTAEHNIEMGIKMLEELVLDYEEMDLQRIREKLARIVMKKSNLEHHFDSLMSCLMKLPSSYLDFVEYGEFHGQRSEIGVRLAYIRFKQDELSEEEKRRIVERCNATEFDSEELRILQDTGLFSADEMMELYRRSLKQKEEFIQRVWSACSSEDDNAVAKAIEGDCYFHGCCVMQNRKKAIELYERAAQLGNAYAMGNLSACYEKGHGVPQDEEKATEWLERKQEVEIQRQKQNEQKKKKKEPPTDHSKRFNTDPEVLIATQTSKPDPDERLCVICPICDRKIGRGESVKEHLKNHGLKLK